MGAFKQQMWAFLHFPLHLALVLCLEGANQLIGWRAATVARNHLINQFSAWNFTESTDEAAYKSAANTISDTVDNIVQSSLLSAGSYAQVLSLSLIHI